LLPLEFLTKVLRVKILGAVDVLLVVVGGVFVLAVVVVGEGIVNPADKPLVPSILLSSKPPPAGGTVLVSGTTGGEVGVLTLGGAVLLPRSFSLK